MEKTWQDRTYLLLGEKVKKINESHIAILGAGGVGGSCIEMFARLGVGQITVVDFDKFDETNLNRQLLCTIKTLGEEKSHIAGERISSINPECIVTTKNAKITAENIGNLLDEDYDYVIDAVDDIEAKIAIIKFCSKNNLKLICSMGAGNRFSSPQFEICDLWKTSYDGLARKLRNELKKEKFFEKINVCYTKQPLEKLDGKLGSIVYFPLACACKIVDFVTNEIIK